MKKKSFNKNFSFVKGFLLKLKEMSFSVLPLIIALLLLSIFCPFKKTDLIAFIIGSVLVIFGQTFFLLGADGSFIPMGELTGGSLTKLKRLPLIILIVLLFGILCAVAEPDIAILGQTVAKLTHSLSPLVLTFTVSLGIGLLLLFAVLKIFLNWNIKLLLFIVYTVVFGLAIACYFVAPKFLSLSFDSGGVTTGPILVPFILALGIGISSSVHKKKGSNSTEFGFVGLSQTGPVIAMLILALFISSANITEIDFAVYSGDFSGIFVEQIWRVAIAILPMLLIFLIFEALFIKLPKIKLIKIFSNMLLTYLGLTLFLTGVNYGFSYAGYHIGFYYVKLDAIWAVFPISFLFGFLVAFTEPSIRVLGEQVEEVTSKRISKKVLLIALSIAIAVASILSVIRLYFNVNLLWILLAGYSVIMIMMIFCPTDFTAIAFDSGSVASGPMAATFLLPFSIGIVSALKETSSSFDVLSGAFGMIALISMVPLIVIEFIGIIFKMNQKRESKKSLSLPSKKDYSGLV